MHLAKDKITGSYIYASEAFHYPNNQWLCPKCNQGVALRQSRRGKWYFQHAPKRSPRQESDWHRQSKLLLAESLRKSGYTVEIEYPFPKIDRIADLYLPNLGQPLVIELQKTPISAEVVRQRTRNYQQCGQQCLWLTPYHAKALTYSLRWTTTLLQYHPILGFYRVCYAPKEGVHITAQLPLIKRRGSDYHHIHCEVLDLIQFCPHSIFSKGESRYFKNKKPMHAMKRRAQLRYQSSQWEYCQILYERGYALEDLPDELFDSSIDVLGMHEPSWFALSLCYVAWGECIRKKDQTWNSTHLQSFLSNELTCADMPFINRSIYLDQLCRELDNFFQTLVEGNPDRV